VTFNSLILELQLPEAPMAKARVILLSGHRGGWDLPPLRLMFTLSNEIPTGCVWKVPRLA
jgi:hypothetical protein